MKRSADVPVAALMVLVLALFGGCKSDTNNPANGGGGSQPNTVTMAGSSFSPATITVSAGTTISWKNNDGIAHTSTSDSTGWDTGSIPGGQSRTTTFSTPGTYAYHCTFHVSMGMRGTVVVQ